MSLAPGTRLGPYEVLAPLGAGGMGEVYRARDTRLGRDVAVKVLPQHLSSNPEVRARFEREAKTVSGLNHPHICTLFDVGREGDTDYLVMELVEGETLAQRLKKGPLALAQVLSLGGQIADALDRAHRAGVVHRDLKPGNVMLAKSGAKLMDFGLARAVGAAGAPAGSGVTVAALTQSPTMTTPLTSQGAIVGTYQYMSPEQLEGQEADVRADVWGLGCVLYEMATGKPAFSGKTQASLIGSIMSAEPAPISQAVPLAPPALEKLVRGCLVKDAEHRTQSAHDVKLQLSWIADGGSGAAVPAPGLARPRGVARLAWGVAAASILAAGVLAVLFVRGAVRSSPVMRFELRVPSSLSPLGPVRVSPDGTMGVFAANDSTGAARLWLRSFDDLECRPLAGTEGTGRPFWSPDGRYVGFFADGKLKKIQVAGGPPETVCDAPGGYDASWASNGRILFDGDAVHTRIRMVSAEGGVPRDLPLPDSARSNQSASWPEALPDGRHYLYSAHDTADKAEIRVGEIGSSRVVRVMSGGGRVEYAPSGHLLFERDGVLMAQRFDPGSGRLSGEPRALVDRLAVASGNHLPYFSASRNGVLVYSPGQTGTRSVVWVDAGGRPLETMLPQGDYGGAALSPNGRYLAYEQRDASGRTNDLWVRDLQRGLSTRFTIDPADDLWPTWSPDSKGLYWGSNRNGRYALYHRDLDGTGTDELVYADSSGPGIAPFGASPDGRYVACVHKGRGGDWDAVAVPVHGGPVVPISTTRFNEMRPRFSPDGRWVAYDSEQSGLRQVFVQAFPVPSAPVQISSAGGFDPEWSSDGHTLYFRSINLELMATEVKLGARFEAGAPKFVCNTSLVATGMGPRYGVSPDGRKFCFDIVENTAGGWRPVVVFGWDQALRKK